MSSLELLDRVITIDPKQDVPLHAQVRRGLRNLIEHHFEDGQKFFTEPELIRELAVSQGTVRRALGDLVREGLLERRVAKGTFVRKSPPPTVRTVGVFVPSWDSMFFSGLLENIALVCRSQGLRLQIYHTQNGEKVADAYRWLERPPEQEAVLLLGPAAAEASELHAMLSNRGYRTVAIDRTGPGLEMPLVVIDNRAGINIGLEHLWGLGHRRITLIVNEPATEPNVVQRVEAYNGLMRSRRFKPRVIDCGTKHWASSFDAAYRAMPQVMEGDPTAIFTVSDDGAWAALKWLAERGIRVPDRMSVLGFDDDAPSRFTQPALTTVAQPLRELAEQAVAQLWERDSQVKPTRLIPKLMIRQSTAAPAPGVA